MGLAIWGEGEAIPRRVVMRLECDLCPPIDVRALQVDLPPGMLDAAVMAQRHGWSLNPNRWPHAYVLCPACR